MRVHYLIDELYPDLKPSDATHYDRALDIPKELAERYAQAYAEFKAAHNELCGYYYGYKRVA